MKTSLRYPADHWASDPDPSSALAKARALRDLPFNKVEDSFFLSLLPKDMAGLSVLEYGCGVGWLSVLCAKKGATVTGIDASEHCVRAAQLHAAQEGVIDSCTFIVATEVRGSGYDLVLAKDVIEHIQDDAGWIRSVAATLTPTGRLILSTQNKWSLTFLIEGGYNRFWHRNREWMGWDPTHLRFYTPGSLKSIVEASGMKIQRWTSMYLVPYDIVHWLSLLRLNVYLVSLRCVDHLLGRVFPFNQLGWSLMAICRKDRSNID